MTLYEKIIHLLKTRPHNLTYNDIAEKTGLNVHWIAALGCGKIRNPGIKDMEKLYEALTGNKLAF